MLFLHHVVKKVVFFFSCYRKSNYCSVPKLLLNFKVCDLWRKIVCCNIIALWIVVITIRWAVRCKLYVIASFGNIVRTPAKIQVFLLFNFSFRGTQSQSSLLYSLTRRLLIEYGIRGESELSVCIVQQSIWFLWKLVEKPPQNRKRI